MGIWTTHSIKVIRQKNPVAPVLLTSTPGVSSAVPDYHTYIQKTVVRLKQRDIDAVYRQVEQNATFRTFLQRLPDFNSNSFDKITGPRGFATVENNLEWALNGFRDFGKKPGKRRSRLLGTGTNLDGSGLMTYGLEDYIITITHLNDSYLEVRVGRCNHIMDNMAGFRLTDRGELKLIASSNVCSQAKRLENLLLWSSLHDQKLFRWLLG